MTIELRDYNRGHRVLSAMQGWAEGGGHVLNDLPTMHIDNILSMLADVILHVVNSHSDPRLGLDFVKSRVFAAIDVAMVKELGGVT